MTSVTFVADMGNLSFVNMGYRFYSLLNITSFTGLGNLRKAREPRYTFSGCTALTVLEDEVADATEMSRGSAFIYLVILDNLVAGKPNTRNMKMKDLEYYMGRIREELGEPSFGNAYESLRQSVEYWDKPQFGKFADNVRKYLASIDR